MLVKILTLTLLLNNQIDPTKIQTLENRVDSLMANARFDEALLVFPELYVLYEEEGLIKEKLKSMGSEAQCYWRLGQFEKSESLVNSIEKLNSKLLNDDKEILGMLCMNKGSIRLYQGQLNEAVELYKKTVLFSTSYFKDSISNLEINAKFNIGAISVFRGQVDTALHYYQDVYNLQMESFRKQGKDTIHVDFIELNNNLAALETDRGYFINSAKRLKKSLEQLEALDMKGTNLYGQVLRGYGNSLVHLGDITSGLAMMEKGRELSKEIAGKSSLYYLNASVDYANFLISAGKFDEAKKAAQSLQEDMGPDKKMHFAQTYNILGTVFMNDGNYTESTKNFLKALKILENSDGGSHLQAAVYSNLIECYQKFNNKEQYAELLPIAESYIVEHLGKKHSGWFRLQLQKARDLTFQNKHDSALSIINYAILENRVNESDELEFYNTNYQIQLLLESTRIFKDRNLPQDLNNALDSYRNMDKLITKNRYSMSDLEDKLSYADSVKTFYEGAINLCLELYKKGNKKEYLEDAFSYVEKSKAFTIYSHLVYANLDVNQGDNTFQQYTLLDNQIKHYQNQLLNNTEDENIEKVNDLLLQSYLKRDSLSTILDREFKVIKTDPKALIKNIDLQKNEVLVNYFFGRSNVYAFVISGQELMAYQIKNDGLEEEITSFRKLVFSPSEDFKSQIKEFQNLSFKLHEAIVKPYYNINETTKLIISPDGPLSFLPFELLTPNQELANSYSGIDYLLKQTSVQYVFSANMLELLKNKPKNSNSKVIAFAPNFEQSSFQILNSEERNGITALPFAQNEINSISDYFDTKQVAKKVATKNNFLKTDLSDYGILHLATHAIVNNNNPLDSKILFSKDSSSSNDIGIIYGYEIQGKKIPAEMVVLSACNTGIGKYRDGEGVQSLANAFFYAGSNSVVMSLWAVNDASTSQLMSSFYHYLSEGNTKSESLRLAKLDYLKNDDPITSNPYYWAGFIINGNDRPVKEPTNWLLILTLSGIALLIALYFIKRRK